MTQTANSSIAASSPDRPILPGPLGNASVAATKSSEIEAGKNLGFWAKLRPFATGMSGVITLATTVVIAVFTVLTWIVMSR